MGPYQVQPLQVKVNLGAMAREGYSTFLKSPSDGVSLSDDIMSYSGHFWGKGSYPSAEMHSVYSNPIYPNPPLGQDMTQGQFLSAV